MYKVLSQIGKIVLHVSVVKEYRMFFQAYITRSVQHSTLHYGVHLHAY